MPDIGALKAQYGEIYELSCGRVVVLCRRPGRAEFHRWQDRILAGRNRAAAFEQLVRDCAVHPTGEELEELFDRYPGAAVAIGARLAELAGLEEEAQVKAL